MDNSKDDTKPTVGSLDEKEPEIKAELTPKPTEAEESTFLENKNTCMMILQKNPAYADVSSVFHWRDPIRSGLLFGIFNFFYILITWGDYTVLTLLSYLALTLLLVCFGYANFVVLKASWFKGTKVENPFKERFKSTKFHVSRNAVEAHIDTILDLTNLTIDTFRDVYYCTNNLVALKFAFYFYLAATIGSWYSGATLIYIVLMVLAIWPRLYEEKQADIDRLSGIAKTQIDKGVQIGLSKLPPAITQKFPGLKPKSS